jgi:capsular exopolysaccharide synthesis family protein
MNGQIMGVINERRGAERTISPHATQESISGDGFGVPGRAACLSGPSPLNLDRVQTITPHIGSERHLVTLSSAAETSLGNEKFLILRHRLALIRQRRPLKTILVTGSIPGEGKTLVALNLAIALSRTSPRVLLVDGDMRKPAVRDALGQPFFPGLCEYLEGQSDIQSSIRQLAPVGLYLLTAGQPTNAPVGLLQGSQMREFMALASISFDWVVFDSPPVNPFADAQCLAAMCDGVVLVARAGMTPRGCIQQTLTALEGSFIAGIVLNGSRDPHSDDYYGYYYSQPKTKKKKPGEPTPTAVSAHQEAKRG